MIDPLILHAFNDEMQKQAKVPGFALRGLVRDGGAVARTVGAPQVITAAKDSVALGKNIAQAPVVGGLWNRVKNVATGAGAAVQNFGATAGRTPIMQAAGQALT